MNDAYLRFPHLHGDLVTFVAEDDVWLAGLDGGRAWRLTADRVPARNPRFSPDGNRIAWTSQRDGDPEVHVTATGGGLSTRLTYWGDPTTTVLGWTPGGDVLARSATGAPSIRRTWAHAIPVNGGPSRRLPYGPVDAVAFGDGAAVLLGSTVSREPAWWKRYRGGTAGKLWLDAAGDGDFERILADVDGHLVCPMWVGGRIAFLSDHEGVGNVYSCAADGSDLRRHSDGEFYARHASTDGARVVYESAGQLWLLDGLDAKPAPLDIHLGGARTGRQPYPVDAADELSSVAPDTTARGSVVTVRGTVHWLSHTAGPARALSVTPGVRGRLPAVLGDTGQVAWVTDASGEDAVEIAPSAGNPPDVPPRRIGSGSLGRVLDLVASPDGRYLAVVCHDGRLLLLDAASGQMRQVARSSEGEPADPAFSPDSAWLAWSHPGPAPLRQIRMAATADLAVMEVTGLRFRDFDPVFTRDGKYLAFLSERNFDPVYDVHVFDMSFSNGCRPYLVPLAADTASPFDPELAGRPVRGADKDGGGDKDTEAQDPPATTVDGEGIDERAVPFPVPAGNYWALQPIASGVAWLTQPASGELGDSQATPDDEPPKPVLERFDFGKRRREQITDKANWAVVSGDGRRVVVRDGARLRVLTTDRNHTGEDGDSPDDDRIDVDLDRVRVTVDPAAEWRQAYDEAGRLMRDHFWRADMNGVDWQAQLDRYRPLVDRVGSHDDLVDLLWEVQGELGTSHAYVTPPGGGGDSRRRVGLLGADIERDHDGRWVVARVLPGESSDPRARSPLRAPGVGVRAGDAILAVDGTPVDTDGGPGPLLAGAAGKPVELTVAPAGGGTARHVVVVPLEDEVALRYHDWVADRRRYVHEATNGRVGYVHLPDMIANGWAQLHRDLRLEVRREALVVDVRENRGGHLSQLVVEKLARRVIGWQVARDRYEVETYPGDAPRGPVVAVANEFSGSDGDIVNAAIKAMGIGPVVGTRTWGGTIGIDMRYHLVDGTLVTQPRYATWMAGPGWGVENHGVEPDVEVVMAPQDWAAGRDPQLDAAIRIALDTLAERPAATVPELPALPGA